MNRRFQNIIKLISVGSCLGISSQVVAHPTLDDIANKLSKFYSFSLIFEHDEAHLLFTEMANAFGIRQNSEQSMAGIDNFFSCTAEGTCQLLYREDQMLKSNFHSLDEEKLELYMKQPFQKGLIEANITLINTEDGVESFWQIRHKLAENINFELQFEQSLPCLAPDHQTQSQEQLVCSYELRRAKLIKQKDPQNTPDQGVAVGWTGPEKPNNSNKK